MTPQQTYNQLTRVQKQIDELRQVERDLMNKLMKPSARAKKRAPAKKKRPLSIVQGGRQQGSQSQSEAEILKLIQQTSQNINTAVNELKGGK